MFSFPVTLGCGQRDHINQLILCALGYGSIAIDGWSAVPALDRHRAGSEASDSFSCAQKLIRSESQL
eukprot:scaffold783_cov23-Cyclotella_meneghiniana.AAC.10